MMGRHSTDLSATGAGRPLPLSGLSCSRRQSRLPDPPKKKKKKKKKVGSRGWTRPLLPRSSNWATGLERRDVIRARVLGLKVVAGSWVPIRGYQALVVVVAARILQ